jgi:NADH-quinone oxidoreductase subunit E
VDHLKKAIGVDDPNAVSSDGLFSYEEVECLGACEFAPMMRLDHGYQYDLTPGKIDTLIAERKGLLPTGGEVSAKPTEGPKKPRAPRKKKDA